MARTVTVTISVDANHSCRVIERRLSTDGTTESLDEFFERMRAVFDQVTGRACAPLTWQAFAQEVLTAYQTFASNADGCINPDIERKARELGLDMDAWL